jgi:hypothetical protein
LRAASFRYLQKYSRTKSFECSEPLLLKGAAQNVH